MALPIAAGALGLILQRVLLTVFVVKAGAIVAQVIEFLGIEFATREYLIGPLLEMAENGWQGMPSEIAAWLGAFYVDRGLSIIFSAYTIAFAKQVFLQRR